jgi:hypothetical protein
MKVDGRLVESWIAGHDAEHFAIVWPVRRADADRETRLCERELRQLHGSESTNPGRS